MNKSAVVLSGVIVALGAVSAGGAWYTGNQLEGVLQTAIEDANTALKSSMAGTDGDVTLELVSLDRGVFTSTARYRLRAQGNLFGEHSNDTELLFLDHIEHGPLPLSRLIALQWRPVMAVSHYQLEKNATTQHWFAATQDAAPLKGVASIDYNRSVDVNIELLPFDLTADDKTSLGFSGLKVALSSTAQAQAVTGSGTMDSFKLTHTPDAEPPVTIELSGLSLASTLEKSGYGFYLGQNTVTLANTKVTFGPQQSVLTVRDVQQKQSSQAKDSNMAGRLDYQIGEIGFQGKPVGSAALSMSMKNIDIPAMHSLAELFQAKIKPLQATATAAAGQPEPELTLSDAEQDQVKADIAKLLSAKPQLAVETLSLKTTNGESRFNLVLDLTNPASTELPPLELGKQLVALLEANLSLSKPMLADIAALQAQIAGQTDAKVIALKSLMAGELVAAMATATQLATVKGNDIVSTLHYANNEVHFNGQTMTVEQFISLVMRNLPAAGGAQQQVL
ncbi:MAG: YdgA family protein [Chromatiaceae bacterium]